MQKLKLTYGSIVRLVHQDHRDLLVLTDGFVDEGVYLKKPSKQPF